MLFTSRFDLIISDIMMPRIDGYEFAKTIREQNKTIPILFMTSRDDISSKQKGFRIGIDDYLVKPFDMYNMDKKELTSAQRARRKYEEKNKEERQQLRVQFTTSLSRKSYDEITAFLEKHNKTKVDLIWAGYFALMEDYDELRKD